MNTIIYSEDFEPITSVELPLSVVESAERRGGIMLSLTNTELPKPLIKVDCRKVTWIDGSTKCVFVTKDEELALLLKPDWLVGQRAVISAYQRTLKILSDKLRKMKLDD